MIHKLKRKFIVLASASMLALMTLLILIMNIVNYKSVVEDCDQILEVLAQPNADFFDEKMPPDNPERFVRDFIPRGMSPEVPYESRYFSVILTKDGKELQPDFSRIISVDKDSSEKYVNEALKRKEEKGFIGDFRYLKISDDKITRLYFLDSGRKLDAYHSFLWTSIAVGCFGCLTAFIVFILVSGRLVRPMAESYEKQKRFLSDAGHEIKTPLTIINANVDLLETELENEELSEIRNQTKRLTKLTNDLVYLSKMEEKDNTLQKIEMPLSDIVLEMANSFEILTAANNIGFTINVRPDITLKGSPDAIRQLVSILLENALKYSPEGEVMSLELSKGKKTAVLTVYNASRYQIREEDLKNVFERFYRTDISRNSETGGHGIGLSIAKAIVEAHNGTIAANTKNGSDFLVTVTLPL